MAYEKRSVPESEILISYEPYKTIRNSPDSSYYPYDKALDDYQNILASCPLLEQLIEASTTLPGIWTLQTLISYDISNALPLSVVTFLPVLVNKISSAECSRLDQYQVAFMLTNLTAASDVWIMEVLLAGALSPLKQLVGSYDSTLRALFRVKSRAELGVELHPLVSRRNTERVQPYAQLKGLTRKRSFIYVKARKGGGRSL